MVCSKTFPVGCVQDSRKPQFWLWFRSRYKLPEFFRTAEFATHTFMGLPPRSWK